MFMNVVAHEVTGHGFWPEYWSILTDRAHIAVELTIVVLLDGVLLGLLWPMVRRFVDHKLHRQHEVFDREHGIHHHDDHVHIDPAIVVSHDEHPEHG